MKLHQQHCGGWIRTEKDNPSRVQIHSPSLWTRARVSPRCSRGPREQVEKRRVVPPVQEEEEKEDEDEDEEEGLFV